MLNECLALDLTDEKGFLCGKILADLGVRVIKVEPPGGDPARRIGPFYKDIVDPEKSLYWMAYNSNKQGITLDLTKPDGRATLKKLTAQADFVIESFNPGYLDSLGLGYTEMRRIKPDLIFTSITPFGQQGPYRDYRTVDIVSMAMSGILYQTGEQDGPPMHMSLPQACLHAGADAALGSLIAYFYRTRSGRGQQVDVSLQQSTAWFLANAVPFYELNHIISRRSGSFRWSLKSSQRQVWKCRDGYVFFNIIGGRTGAKTLHELVNWMESEGRRDDYLHDMNWDTLDMFAVDQAVVDRISRPIEEFFAGHSRQEISSGAVRRSISICPLSSMQDLHNDKQLESRRFWTSLPQPELQESLTYPKSFIQSSEMDFSLRMRAPLIGEHNAEILTPLESPDASPAGIPLKNPVQPLQPDSNLREVFKGLIVTSFSWAIVGPLSMKYLADFGATVIRLETAKRPCTLRISTPYKDNQAGLNRSGYFNHFSSNMLSMALNMENPRAAEIVHRLTARSDVLMENFTPGVMEKWGFSYENLKKIKPDLIMLRQSGFGNRGPSSHQPAFGMILAAMAGIPNFIGQPDGSPLPIGVSAYTDGISPRFAISALIAALDYRNRTGKGQLLDISQFETALSFIAPALLDYSVNGREPLRQGNRDPAICPHDVFRCQGEDRWCAIAAADNDQWAALCRAIGKPDMADDVRLQNPEGRRAHEEEINLAIGNWTACRSAEDCMQIFQAAGVPSGVVKNAADIYADPQLARRGLFWKMQHPEMGQFTHLGQGFLLSETPARPVSASPLLGEHTEQVCTQILGMSDPEFAEAASGGLFE